MTVSSSFETEVLRVLWELKSDVSELKSDMGEIKTRLSSLEDTVLDVRDEMRAENVTTRTLLSQAFTHISDQLAREGDMDFVPKYPRTRK